MQAATSIFALGPTVGSSVDVGHAAGLSLRTADRLGAMRRLLSPRQQSILAYVREYQVEHGYPPTIRETAKACGLRGTSTTHAHLVVLMRAGFVERRDSGARCYWPVSDA